MQIWRWTTVEENFESIEFWKITQYKQHYDESQKITTRFM